jgi:hypothetical protein
MQIDTQNLEQMQSSLALRQRNNFIGKTNAEADRPMSFFLGRGKKTLGNVNIHKITIGNITKVGPEATKHMQKIQGPARHSLYDESKHHCGSLLQ